MQSCTLVSLTVTQLVKLQTQSEQTNKSSSSSALQFLCHFVLKYPDDFTSLARVLTKISELLGGNGSFNPRIKGASNSIFPLDGEINLVAPVVSP